MDLSKCSGNQGGKNREKLSVEERGLGEGEVLCIWAGHKTKSTTSSEDVLPHPAALHRDSSDESSQAGSRTRIRKTLRIWIYTDDSMLFL